MKAPFRVPPAEDPLLLDGHRERIPGARPQAQEDNDLLCVAAACARSRIVLSYSRLDLITGRQRVPSFYVFEALRAARGQAVDVRDIEREAERGAHTRIGWPAPPDAAQAIDDAEYDLAVLRPAFDDPARRAGRRRLSRRVNPHLVRSLRARGRRWRKNWFAETGSPNSISTRCRSSKAIGWRAVRTPLPRCSSTPRVPTASPCAPSSSCTPRIRARRSSGWTPPCGARFSPRPVRAFRRTAAAGALPVRPDGLAAALARLDGVLDRVASTFAEEWSPAIPHVGRRRWSRCAPTCAAGCSRHRPSRVGRPRGSSSLSACRRMTRHDPASVPARRS